MRSLASLCCTVALAVSFFGRPVPAASIVDFIDFSLRAADDQVLFPGLLHVPAEAASDPDTPRPLILFLHGSGESGTDNRKQINGNIDNLLAAAKTRGAFLYAPQTNSGWGNSTVLANTMTMVDRAIAGFHADLNRIYVTGLSMGGGGVWNYLHEFPERFAAGAPICAVGPAAFDFLPATLLSEPIWAFHGRADTTVSASVSRDVVNSILDAAGRPLPDYPPLSNRTVTLRFSDEVLDLRYTEYATFGHSIWGFVYRSPELYDWMFAHGAVPEPTAWVLVATSSLILCLRRR